MIESFAGVSGKLKRLLDRLTATRAANLDNLNATISSRAAAATALANTMWTNAKAGFLDAAISSRAKADLMVRNMPQANLSTRVDLDYGPVNAKSKTFYIEVDVSALTADVYVTVINITASKGVFTIAAPYHNTGDTHKLSAKLTVDGILIRDYAEYPHSSAGQGLFLIGTSSPVVFHDSIKIEIKSNINLSAGDVVLMYEYWLV